MKKFALWTMIISLVWLLGATLGWAQKYEGKEGAELAKALQGAKVSLEKGLSESKPEGKPISGKFEMENGKLQLSIYTEKGGKFSEVLVDPMSGKVVKVEAIGTGEDLTAAKAQAEAMAQAKWSLHKAIKKALKAHKEFRAVSIVPILKEGHPVADITLVKGEEYQTVSEMLH